MRLIWLMLVCSHVHVRACVCVCALCVHARLSVLTLMCVCVHCAQKLLRVIPRARPCSFPCQPSPGVSCACCGIAAPLLDANFSPSHCLSCRQDSAHGPLRKRLLDGSQNARRFAKCLLHCIPCGGFKARSSWQRYTVAKIILVHRHGAYRCGSRARGSRLTARKSSWRCVRAVCHNTCVRLSTCGTTDSGVLQVIDSGDRWWYIDS